MEMAGSSSGGISRRAVGKTNSDAFNCPICFEIPRNRIFVCSAGHSICEGCQVKLTNCPMCDVRYGLTPGRNFSMESVLVVIDFSCKYEEFGCDWIGKRNAIFLHEPSCRFRPIKCISKDCAQKYPFDNYMRHVMSHKHIQHLILPFDHQKSNLIVEFQVKYQLRDNTSEFPIFWINGFSRTKFFLTAFIETERFYLGVSFLDQDDERKYRFDAQFSYEYKTNKNYPVWKFEGGHAPSIHLPLDTEKKEFKDIYYFSQPLKAFSQFKKASDSEQITFGIDIKIHHCQFAKRSKKNSN